MSSVDYSPLLPLDLGPKLGEATTSWHAVKISQDAILMPLFIGAKGFQPDVFAVHNNVNTIGSVPISLCQDIASYGKLFSVIVGPTDDRQRIANTLLVMVDRWHAIDPNELARPQSEIARLLEYDIASVNEVKRELKTLADRIAAFPPSESAVVDDIFNSSLFELVSQLLGPIAQFSYTPEGIARFADATNLTIAAVNIPLKHVFKVPIKGKPISTPSAVSEAVVALHDRIQDYFSKIDQVIRSVDLLVGYLNDVATSALLIPGGIEKFASAGPSNGFNDVVDKNEAEKAWTNAGAAAEWFVLAISGPSRVVTFGNRYAGRIVQEDGPTRAVVEKALGPPSDSAITLCALVDQTIQTRSQLRAALALPYSGSLKVEVNGVETSLFSTLVDIKATYEGLQNRFIPIVQNIQTYSMMQKTVLPILTADLGVQPTDLFKAWATLAASYNAEAARVVTDYQELQRKFQGNVDTLRSNLDKTKARITSLIGEFDTAQKEYDVAKVQALLDDFLTMLFTVGAVAGAYEGEGEVVKELGGKATETLSRFIEEDMKADQLTVLIHQLENMISVAEHTSDQLQKTISLLIGGVQSMTQVGQGWEDICSSLSLAEGGYAAWVEAKLLTPELLGALASRWALNEKEAIHYVNGVLGIKIPTSVNLLSLAISGVSEKDIHSVNFGIPSDTDSQALRKFYTLDNDPVFRAFMNPTTVKDQIAKFQALHAAASDDQLYKAIEAPTVDVTITRQSLTDAANLYFSGGDVIQSQFPKGAEDMRNLGTRINSDVIPLVTEVMLFYIDFATRQKNALSIPPTKSGLEELARENAASAVEGSTKAKAAQVTVLDFKNQSVLVDNELIQRSKELQTSYDSAERELKDRQAELAEYEWVKWWPFPPGIGLIINAIVEAIKQNEENIRKLRDDMSYISQAKGQLDAVHKTEEACLSTVINLAASWATLTQDANDLAAYLTIISELPSTASAFADTAKETWQDLIKIIQQWDLGAL